MYIYLYIIFNITKNQSTCCGISRKTSVMFSAGFTNALMHCYCVSTKLMILKFTKLLFKAGKYIFKQSRHSKKINHHTVSPVTMVVPQVTSLRFISIPRKNFENVTDNCF